jgi:hypothetical protein
MDGLGLAVVEFDNLDAYDPQEASTWESEEARELNDILSDDGPVQYRTFHTYPLKDTNG